ncbi:MAG: hypothetical protein A3I11_02140 [Elusimicrobia bacterium RIFCSPLOWO2_02_FULL_39_32]|nr:MAG: hypothetical protein A2034_01120 [Elusimicrobia bacterium GWA2_38_7]OGR78419.1 MAG: hypothetical protein A3B80_07025 [Elusimicrobia bacterium RIFCSPHIGHO2_02_FULL_39_36]OGR92178.1 MAG: hypothetical protein A3I11_02140 [Elusimicrobia bacterium RIFCSPLOWO2_02_FULL_39_32]
MNLIFSETSGKLCLILFIAIILRFIFFTNILHNPERMMYGDSKEYHQLALNLLNRHEFGSRENGSFMPDAERQILYPLFVAGIYLFSGHRPEVIAFFQNLIDVLSVFLIFCIGQMLAGRSVALVSSTLYAMNPIPLLQNQFLLTETLFIFLILVGLFGLFYSMQRHWIWIFISSIAWGLATYIRHAGMFMVVYLGIFTVALQWQTGKIQAFARCAATCGLFLLLLLPWYVRNYTLFNKIFFSTSSKKTFVIYHVGHTLSRVNNVPPREVLQDFFNQTLSKQGESELSRLKSNTKYWSNWWNQNPYLTEIFYQEGVQKLSKYPKVYLFGLIQNVLRLSLFPSSSKNENITFFLGLEPIPIHPLRKELKQFLSEGNWIGAIRHFLEMRIGPLSLLGQILWLWLFLFEGPVLILGLLTLFSVFYYKKSFFLKLFCSLSFLTVFYFFASPGLDFELRYRFPVEPLLCLCAAIFLCDFNQSKTCRTHTFSE